MITAIVQYKLSRQIDQAECRDHFHEIAGTFDLFTDPDQP